MSILLTHIQLRFGIGLQTDGLAIQQNLKHFANATLFGMIPLTIVGNTR